MADKQSSVPVLLPLIILINMSLSSCHLVKENRDHCPCRLEKTPDTKCMCKEFRDQIADPEFEGFCHCMLYYKEK